MEAQTIFGDEAGFTGENMIDDDQPYFCYTTIAATEDECKEIIDFLRVKYRFQNNNELKGKILYRRSDIHLIVEDLLEKLKGKFITTVDHKKFTVCCRLFEYIYEPVFANRNSIFYKNYFHLSLANMLFISIFVKDPKAIKIFNDLYHYLRWGKVDDLEILFKAEYIENNDDLLDAILRFAYIHKFKIFEEFTLRKSTSDVITPDWFLDLSITKVNHMLAQWGQKYDKLTVILDESKPLFSDYATECFKPMIDRKGEQVFMQFGSRKTPITYNLKELPTLKSSKDSHGIQLADLVSSIFLKSLNNSDNDKGKQVQTLFISHIENDGFIFPDTKYVEVDKFPLAFINKMVMLQIDEWTKNHIDPLDQISEFYSVMFDGVINNPPKEFEEAFSKYNSIEEIICDF